MKLFSAAEKETGPIPNNPLCLQRAWCDWLQVQVTTFPSSLTPECFYDAFCKEASSIGKKLPIGCDDRDQANKK